jgi:hypothetical protein
MARGCVRYRGPAPLTEVGDRSGRGATLLGLFWAGLMMDASCVRDVGSHLALVQEASDLAKLRAGLHGLARISCPD